MEKFKIKIDNKLKFLKIKLTYTNVLKWLVILATLIIAYNSLSKIAYASPLLSYGNGDDPFASITKGWGQFVADKYRNNYYLDILNLSTFEWMDKSVNWLVNVMFNFVVLMAWFGINIFKFCFTNDIAEAFGDILENVMNSLNNGIFNSFFMIVFMISLFSIVYQLWKKNYSAIAGQLIAVSIIFALSGVFANGAVKFLSASTEFSKMIGTQAIVSITGTEQEQNSISENNLENYSKQVVGTLWGNFVHQPWVMLEFDGKLPLVDESNADNEANQATESYSQKILSHPEGSSEREKVLEDVRKEYGDDLFSEDSLSDKFVSLFLLIIITAIKMIILIAIGMLQIGFQLLSILLVLLVPLILLIAIVPFFGGTNLIIVLGKKFLGTQLGIIISSFILAFLVLIDNVTLNMFQSWGANLIMALLMQCACWLLLICFRKKLFSGLNSLQNKIASGTASPLKLSDKILDKSVDASNKYITDPVITTAADVKNNVMTKAEDTKNNLKAKTNYAGEYTKSNLSLYKDKKLAQAIDFLGTKYDDFKNKYTDTSNLSDANVENSEALNLKKNLNNPNIKPTEKLDLNGVTAKKPIEDENNKLNKSNENLENNNSDDEIISKNDTDRPKNNKSVPGSEFNSSSSIKNNGISESSIANNEAIKDNVTHSEEDKIITKPEELKTSKNKMDTVPLNIEKDVVESTNLENINEDLVEKQNIDGIKKADIKNKANSNSIKKETIQKANNLTDENIVSKKSQHKNINPNKNKPKEKVDTKTSTPINPNDRVEKLKNFLGVTDEQITKKEKAINTNLNKLKKDIQKRK
ncbi:TcpH [Clostridium perfringens]|uniref:TcpH n=1 Tax=Clostridium perfringens TaxID=1502 RepID=UPI0024BCF22C|nr:TcpH [Clostridium perfringens]